MHPRHNQRLLLPNADDFGSGGSAAAFVDSVCSRSAVRYADLSRGTSKGSQQIPSIFHNPVIDLASDMQERSARRFGQLPPSLARSAFQTLTMDAVRVHRAVGSLVDAGWPGESGALLRTEIDIAVSCLALNHSAEPEVAAFRYMIAGLRRYHRDQNFPAESRVKFRSSIRAHIERLAPDKKALALRVLRERDRPYWFAQEFSSPTNVLTRFARPEVVWSYAQLSGAAHGSFVGLRLHREDPDVVGIDPDEPGPRTISADLFSCKFTLETLTIRNKCEQLGFEARLAELSDDLRVGAERLGRAR